MEISFPGAGQPVDFNFSAALGAAQKAHQASLTIPGADVFSELRLNPASVGRELPSIAKVPAASLGYTAVPNWKIWQDF